MQPQLSLRQYQQLTNKQQEFKNPEKQPNHSRMLNCPKQQKKYKSYGSYSYSTLRNTKHRTKVLYQKSKDYATSSNTLANLPKLNRLILLQPKRNQKRSRVFIDGHQISKAILCQFLAKAQTQPQLYCYTTSKFSIEMQHSVKDMWRGSGITLEWKGVDNKVGEQPWSQLVCCALICCRTCGCIFQEDGIVVRSAGEKWYID